jgi:hypothetical protein
MPVPVMKDTKQPLEPAGESCGRPQVEIKDEGDDLTLLGTVQNDGEARLASASTGNELRWSESSSVETGFSILRCSSEYGDYDVVGWVGPKTTSYLDATAPTNEVNWYKVREEGPGGPLYSDGVSIARPPVSVTALMSALSESPGDFGAFRFTRDDWYPNYETAVRFTLGGEAAAGVDYELIGPDGQAIEDGVVTIPAKRDSVDVIVRAIADNVSELNERIVLTLTAGAADGYRLGFWAEATLTIHETPDLIDIDSDNTNGFDDPDGTPEEDRIEDDATKPGKILAVNDNDDDGDGIPDFADGFDWDGITSEDDRAAFDDPNTPEHEPQEQFVPVILVLPEGVNPSVAKVKLTYSASDPRPYHVGENPDGLQRTGSGTAQDPYIYAAGPGDLRLWTKDGSAARDKASLATGGDFVPSNVELSWSALPDGPTADTKRLWLEAIAPSTNLGDQQITVSLDPDGPGPGGYVASDAVRATAYRVRYVGVRLDVHNRPVRDPYGQLIFDREIVSNLLPKTESNRLASYVDWQLQADGYLPTAAYDDGINGALSPLIDVVDAEVNLDRLLFKIAVDGPSSLFCGLVRFTTYTSGQADMETKLSLTPGAGGWVSSYPVLLYDDTGVQFDAAFLQTLLPLGTRLLDPDQVGTLPGWIDPARGTVPQESRVSRLQIYIAPAEDSPIGPGDPLQEHAPAGANPSAMTEAVPAGEPVFNPTQPDRRFAFVVDGDDVLPHIRFMVGQYCYFRAPPLEEWLRTEWFLRYRFTAGNVPWGAGVTFRIDQWHSLNTVNGLFVDLDLNHVITNYPGLPVGDYELFFRATDSRNPNSPILESNLIQFKILGTNPGRDRILAFIDTLDNPTIEGITFDVRGWYKAILHHEAAPGPYTNHLAWDQFERNPESAGIDIGFQRDVGVRDRPRQRWLARYGFPFVTYDNGWGIAQITGNHNLSQISRWENNVRMGWNRFISEKLTFAIQHLKNISRLPLNAIPAEIVIKEAVREYNGGREYVYEKGQFISRPNVKPEYLQYVNEVVAIKNQNGY